MRRRRNRNFFDNSGGGRGRRSRDGGRGVNPPFQAADKVGRVALPAPAFGPGAVALPARTSLATLLASHVLRDGELVLLILRPSPWFILLSSLRWIAAGAALMIVAALFGVHATGGSLHVGALPGPFRGYAEAGVALIAGRIMWAALQWMGRLYVLTDLRVLSLSGVVRVEVFDCSLRKVARTRLVRFVPDRLSGVGTIEIIPHDDASPFGQWQTVARPKQVHEQIVATISRAKQNCPPMG